MTDGGHYHLIGIAGVGMNALAQALISEGYSVSGSDRHYDRNEDMEVIRKLKLAGVRLVAQNGTGITSETKAAIVSTAIEDQNPDILRAKEMGIQVIHRARMLARLCGDRTCIAVTGTSGKSTVTGMIGWVFEQAGLDPAVVNGGTVLNWCNDRTIGNVRCGNGPWILEADESDRSLLEFSPDWGIITNISKDHFDIQETTELFKVFSGQVKKGLINGSDYFNDFNPSLSADGSTFVYDDTLFRICVPGLHNAENAFLTVIFCVGQGIAPEKIARALALFRGIERRLEVIGSDGNVMVIDDYAHNPAKIAATWQTIAPYHRRIIGVWRPHGFGPLRNMMNDLTATFSRLCREEDMLYLLPVYDAGGTADRSVNSDDLARKLEALGIAVKLAGNEDDVVKRVVGNAAAGDVVLIMGARDPGLPVLARRILAGLKSCSGPDRA